MSDVIRHIAYLRWLCREERSIAGHKTRASIAMDAACDEIERLRNKAKLIIKQSDRLLMATDCDCDWRYEQGRKSAAEDILAEVLHE